MKLPLDSKALGLKQTDLHEREKRAKACDIIKKNETQKTEKRMERKGAFPFSPPTFLFSFLQLLTPQAFASFLWKTGYERPRYGNFLKHTIANKELVHVR